MSVDFLESLIVPGTMAICICLGVIIKNFSKIPNEWIPVILATVGVIIALWDNWGNVTSDTIGIGLVSGLAACGAYESYRHLFGKKNKTESEG